MHDICPKMRIAKILLFFAVSLTVASCTQLGLGDDSPTSPTGPPKTGSTINYSAIGASDAIGYGSSQICALDCSNGMGYVFVTTRALRAQGFTVNLTLAAFPGETIGPDFQALQTKYVQTIPFNEIDESLFVTRDANVVTIFGGGNDTETVMAALGGGAGGSTPSTQTAFIDSQIAAFAKDYDTLVANVRARSKSARIVVMNLPNFAGIPLHSGDPLLNRQAVQRLSVGMTNVINKLTSQGVLVVDLMCDSRFYQASTYSSDGFHPNDSGYALMSGLIVQAINSSSYANPAASCSQMTIVP